MKIEAESPKFRRRDLTDKKPDVLQRLEQEMDKVNNTKFDDE